MPSILVVLVMKVLIMLHEVTFHHVWPFKEWLVLNFLQDLVYWFSEYCVNHLSGGRPQLPNKVSLRSVIVVSVRLEIPPFLRDNLNFPIPLLLIVFNPLVLINSVH